MSKVEPLITYDFEIENLKKYLKPVRIAYGLNREEISAILGIAPMTWSHYENKQVKMNPVMYLAIKGALYDVANQYEDRDYYIQIWNYFIEGIYAMHSEVPPSVRFVDDHTEEVANQILRFSKSYSFRTGVCLYDMALEIKDMLQEEWPEIFA